MSTDPVSELRSAVIAATDGLGEVGGRPSLERPPKPELGDYSTNAAMLLAKSAGRPPRELAEEIRERLSEALGDSAREVVVAGPGFVNVFFADRWYRDAVASVLEAERFGRSSERRRDVLLEFVSANPTGPLTVAGGRNAAYGDSLGRVLEAAGHPVSREYYVNDAGTQIRNFAASIAARMRGEEPPEDGYAGEYIGELAEELRAEGVGPDDLDRIAIRGVELMLARIEATLERFGVRFDVWSSERALHEKGAVEKAVERLREGGYVYEQDGAVWLRTTDFGDDKDRVLIRSDGQPTYFAADVAYHADKLERGADLMITPLGADHHGYVPRMKAAVACLGADPERYEAPILQLVHVVEGGERARMSKRKGEFVTLDELMEDIGVDAARYFLVQRSHDTTIDLDLELARSESQDNPVYYVQYAHARIASILRKAADEGVDADEEAIVAAARSDAVRAAPAEPSERALIRRLLDLPAEIQGAAERRAPHRICAYATATAADFHAFYRDCRVLGADEEAGVEGLQAGRLALCLAAKRVLATALDLVGCSAPERM
ncbi:MAG TPA: arginine--tRNA ligase [Solirubrobacterales bacterium]